MRKPLAVLALVATAAWAGETYIGAIVVTDGGTASNASTGYLAAGCASQTDPGGAGACGQAFRIGTGAKLTIQCDVASCASVNRPNTDGGICQRLAADEKFPTSVATVGVPASLPDGGTYVGGLVSIAGTARCTVSTRSGTE